MRWNELCRREKCNPCPEKSWQGKEVRLPVRGHVAADRAETATAIIVVMVNRVFEMVLNNVMQQRRLPKHEQQD